MIIDREFDQKTLHQLKVIPIEELKAFLNARVISAESQTSSEPSKWAKVAEEAANLGISHETGEFFRATIKEFRNDEGV